MENKEQQTVETMIHSRALALPARILGIYIIILLLSSANPTTIEPSPAKSNAGPAAPSPDPLGHFEGFGMPAGISWTGDGQRISNPYFATGSLGPWIETEYNAISGSGATISTPGYVGANSAQLTVLSGNLSTTSYVSLLNDLSQNHAGFSSSERFRATVLLKDLTGTSVYDRVEIGLILTSSTGGQVAVHYIFVHGSSLPSNTTTDAYYSSGVTPVGQWVTIDRDLAEDASAAFPTIYPSLDSASQVTLTVDAQTQPGAPNQDPHIKYWDVIGNGVWDPGEPVVYDVNNTGFYATGDPVIGGCFEPGPETLLGNPIACSAHPSPGQELSSSPFIKFVDTSGAGAWQQGEPVIYDCGNPAVCNENMYVYYDPVLVGPVPPIGTLLMKIVQNQSSSLFGMIELYSASGGSEWIKNGGFETGLNGWGPGFNFTVSCAAFLTGGQCAIGTATNGTSEIAQSIDARPSIDNSMVFNAAVNISTLSGTSSSDMVDIWLGLVDGQSNPLSLYYVFKTGDGSMPANRTDAIYRKIAGFGVLDPWIAIREGLAQETAAFNAALHPPPFRIELVVLEVTAHGSTNTTTAYFDNLSLRSASYAGTALSNFYAWTGLNTTYLYTAPAIPQGSLYLEIPSGQTILNITSPEGTALKTYEYNTTTILMCTVNPCTPAPRAVYVPESTFFRHSPVGDWRIFATSKDPITSVYAEDPVSRRSVQNVNVGYTVNLVSQTKDPSGQPMVGVQVNLTLWNTRNGAEVGSWPGSTDSLGWYNVSGVTLPLPATSPGIYGLQATVNSIYAGIRTFQVPVRYEVTVTMSISSTHIAVGQSVTISGAVTETISSSPVQGVNVTIWYRLAGENEWAVLGNATTGESGQYTYAWSPPQGDFQIKALTGDSQTARAESLPLQLTAGPRGFVQQYWQLLAGIAGAASVIALVTVTRWRRRRTPPPREEWKMPLSRASSRLSNTQ